MQSRYQTTQSSPLTLGFLHAHVVCGEASRRQSLRKLLGESGFEIDVVSSPSQAYPIIRNAPPSLLLVTDDIQTTPDALGLLRWLRNQEFHDSIYVLVLCDTSNDERVQSFLRNGACDVLTLEFSQKELSDRLQVAEHRSVYLRSRSDESRLLREQATQYQKVVSHWPQAAILAPNLSRPITEVNQRALEILGLTHEEVTGKYLSLILPDLFEREDFIPYEDFSKNPKRLEDVVYESPDGNVLLEVRIVGMAWEKEGAILVTFENLGRLHAIERNRSRVSRVETVRRFASEMAHEFNNILTVVNGNLSLLSRAEASLPETSQQLITSSQQACRRATDLVKRLTKQRDFGQPNLEVVNTAATVAQACAEALLSPRAKVDISTSDNLWAAVADERLLREALKALLKNADEALANSVIEVDVENLALGEDTSLPLHANDYLRIAVIDEGPGILPSIAERAFEPFFTTRSDGEGLGLPLALKIAEDHGGTLQIEPTPTGKGTCLALYLPADRKATPFPTNETSKEETPSEKVASGEDNKKGWSAKPFIPRVLFMDDEPDIRTIVDKILSAHDFDVTCTTSGEEAIDAYYRGIEEDNPYDVLLLDLEVVGGMGGKDTIAILRQDFPNIKAVVTTGYLDDIVLANHREHGFSGVLTKPFQIDDLISVLNVLGGPTG